MLLKIILVFLALMALVGMIGKALFPGQIGRVVARKRRPAICKACGRHVIGQAGCDCGRDA